MLQAIREKAQGWIAWAIVILISIPFALWGIQEYLGVGAEPEVAVVDGEPVTERMLDQRVRDFRESLRVSLGDSYRSDLFEEKALKEQVREAMIEELVLVKHAADWNLRTADAQARGFIASIPAFQRDGGFDQLAYETAVRNRGMSRSGFEQSVLQDLAVGQLRAGVRDTVFVTEAALAERVRLGKERRTVAYARVAADAYRDEVQGSEEELRRYYDNNLDRYRTPERVRLGYLVLDAATLTGFIEASEDDLRAYFDAHRSEFMAREERSMRHILIAVPPGADETAEQAAYDQAAELLAQIRDGADFASLAEEHSGDPGSAANGGDLGWVERGVMVEPFEEAAFALGEGEVSELVRTDFGIHIIQVTGLRGGSEAGFGELRDQVDAAFRKFEAENLYFDYAERLAESAYENAASLEPAAEALGLKVQLSDWITREAVLPGVLGSPRVANAAFSEDVLVEGNNSELIEVGPQQAVVVRVVEHEPAGVKPFDAHRAEIEDDYRDAMASQAAEKAGAGVLEQLNQGALSLSALAADKGWALEESKQVDRESFDLPAEVLAGAFTTAPPEAGAAAHVGVTAANGDYLLIAIESVEYGDVGALADADGAALKAQTEQQLAAAQLGYFVDRLKANTKVELKPISD
jgi:peptidyl-prolyl cis-trans isomerase D